MNQIESEIGGDKMRKLAAITCSTAFFALSGTQVFAAGDVAAGEKVFKKCKACHVVNKEQNRTGPHLVNLFDRAAGSLEGYKKYSKAMKSSGIVWDEETLDVYLKAPKKYVKGTRMAFAGLKKDADRANVIAYMKTFSK
tara:strand:+ start:1420 stop:1836 length:417 start_codon:yes stop_codon:yes gene_type:complete